MPGEPKLEPINMHEEDFRILGDEPQSEHTQTQQEPQESSEVGQEQAETNRGPQSQPETLKTQPAICECPHCGLLKQLLTQYSAHNPGLSHPTLIGHPQSQAKTANTEPSELSKGLKALTCQLKQTVSVCFAKLNELSIKTKERARSLSEKIKAQPLKKRGKQACLAVLALVLLSFTVFGVFAAVECHITMNRPREASQESRSMYLRIQTLQHQLHHQEAVIQEKDSLISVLNFQLQKAREQLESLTSKLQHVSQTALSQEQLVRIAGLNQAELDGQVELQYTQCLVPNFEFQFLGNHNTGEYMGSCIGQTPHGLGAIATPDGRVFKGAFRGGRMHGEIFVRVGDRTDEYQFVHGVEHGFYHTKGYHNSEEFGCRVHGNKVGPQMQIDTTGKLKYSLISKQGGFSATTILVSDDGTSLKMEDHTGEHPRKGFFVLSNSDIPRTHMDPPRTPPKPESPHNTYSSEVRNPHKCGKSRRHKETDNWFEDLMMGL